jgi:hypothetical protein
MPDEPTPETQASAPVLLTREEKIANEAKRRLAIYPELGKEKAMQAAEIQIDHDEEEADAALELATRPAKKK